MTVVSIDLAQIREDIEQKKQELADLQALERAAARYAVAHVKARQSPRPEAKTLPAASDGEFGGLLMFQAITKILQRAQRPMRAREIADILNGANYGHNVGNLPNSVFTAMRRKPSHFEKTGVGLWKLKNGATEEEEMETPQ